MISPSSNLDTSCRSDVARTTLTSQEEATYGKRIQRMIALFEIKEKLVQQLHQSPSNLVWAGAANLSLNELALLLKEGQRARQQLREAHQHLVLHLAQRYTHLGLELDALILAGNVGLEQAIATFKPAREYEFSTYALWWIQQKIAKAIANSKTPKKNQKTNRAKSDDSLQGMVQVLLTLLTPQQQAILSMRYGLWGDDPLETDTIAEQLGWNLEQVEQLHRSAMAQLQPWRELNPYS